MEWSLVNPVPAYILAGGRSRRMGRDKATLRPDPAGPSLAERVAAVLHTVGVSPIHVVGRQPELHTLALVVVPDPVVDLHHPLLGVAAALDHAAQRGFARALIVPCDVPSLTTAALSALLAEPGPAVAVAGDHVQPLLATLPSDQAASALATARAGGSARRWVLGLGVAQVQIPVPAAQDVDTPADLAAWVRSRPREQ